MGLTKGRTLLAIAIVLGGALAILAVRSWRKPTLRLADGTVLTVEKISFGKRVPFTLHPWRERFQRLIDRLPARFSDNLPHFNSPNGAWSGGELPNPADDALYIWLTRRESKFGRYVDTGLSWAQIVDEHRCPFFSAQSGGMNGRQGTAGPAYEVGWFAFQAFPRRQKRFRLRVYGAQKELVGEFVVTNPQLRGAAAWKAEPLPVTRHDGDLAFTLKSLSFQSNTIAGTGSNEFTPPPVIASTFEVRELGKPTTDWEAVQMDLSDGSGNRPSRWPFRSPFLCPLEPAWKLQVKFCANTSGRLASNDFWTVPHLALPAPGSFDAFSATRQVQGLTLRLVGLAGAGHTHYSNDVPVRAQPLTGLEKEDYSETRMATGTGLRMDTVDDVQMPTPHVALRVSGLIQDRWLSAQMTDAQGKTFFAKVWGWDFVSDGFKEMGAPYLGLKDNALYFLGFDLSPEVKQFNLIIGVHRARTVEFLVQPPRLAP